MRKHIIILALISVSYFGHSQILKQDIPDKLVVLTFDDGCASHHSFVAPLLKQYGFNATFFMCEFPPNYKDSTKYMTWEQVKDLSKMGFEVANHTLTHQKVNKITKAQFIDQVKGIENKCDSIGIAKPTSFAYPAYDLNPSALQILKEMNYKYARAGGSRVYNPLEDHPYLIPSWTMKSDNKHQIMEAFHEAKNGNIVVITIHGVPDIEHPWVNTPPELFKEYLQYLSANGFKVISIKDLDNYIDNDMALKSILPEFSKKLKG